MTDSELWDGLRNGNKSSFEEIYRQNFKNLYRYGVKICRNEMIVEDCLQNLFIELWSNRGGLGKTDSIIKYLTVSLRRKIIRELKTIHAKEIGREIVETDFEAEISFEAKLMQAELDAEKSKALEKAFQILSPRQREVLYLKYFNGMSYEDIGGIMGINYQSVRNLVSRALKQLQEAMLVIIMFFYLL